MTKDLLLFNVQISQDILTYFKARSKFETNLRVAFFYCGVGWLVCGV